MGYHERNWINNYSASGPSYYRRYVDDIFALFENESDAERFFKYLNEQHPNIKFTLEKQNNGKIPFLDVLIENDDDKFFTSVYHKPTHTGLLTNYFSFIPNSYKISLIRTLVDRTFKNNNT